MTGGLAAPVDLADELGAARADLLDALSAVALQSMTTPGLLGDWSGRDLLAHVGYWAGNAVEVIHAVEEGRADEVGAGRPPTDVVNATVARVARETALATVMKREAASVQVLVDRLGLLDAALLELRLPDGATLREAIRGDGSDHYREHAAELRRSLTGAGRG